MNLDHNNTIDATKSTRLIASPHKRLVALPHCPSVTYLRLACLAAVSGDAAIHTGHVASPIWSSTGPSAGRSRSVGITNAIWSTLGSKLLPAKIESTSTPFKNIFGALVSG